MKDASILARASVVFSIDFWRQRNIAPLRDHFVHRPSVRLSHLLFAYNFLSLGDRAFIFAMRVPYIYDETFPKGPYILSTWSWPWPLTYIWKTLTLQITFLPLDIVLSFWGSVFLMTIPLRWYYKFSACDLDGDLWPSFKKLNSAHNFLTIRHRDFIFSVCVPYIKTFLEVK